jgi:hypothetical protein
MICLTFYSADTFYNTADRECCHGLWERLDENIRIYQQFKINDC